MKAEKNYSDETKHRQSPIQTHHTKSEITKPSFQEKERLWTPLCAQFTDRTQLLEAAPSVAMSCQVLLNGCIFSLCFSCHRKLPSTSQANYPLPIELHSWIIIIDFWSSVINVLKMCLHSQLSNTIKEVLPETGFGLSCLHPIFAPGYIKWLLQFGPAEMLFPKSGMWAQLTTFSSTGQPSFPCTQQAFVLSLALHGDKLEHSSRGSLTSRYLDLQNIQVLPDFNAPIASMS